MKFLISVFILCFSFAGRAEVVDRIVAIVNNEIVTDSDIRDFSKRAEKGKLVDDLLLFGKTPDSLRNNPKEQLQYLINERIISSEIKRLNLSVTMEKVDQEIRDLAKKNGVSKNDLLAAVKNQGLSVSEYQDFIKTRIERQSLVESEITSKIRVSDDDVISVFQRRHPEINSSSMYEYTLSHIYFNPRKEGGVSSAQARAKKAFDRIKAGTKFEEVAEQTSEDPTFANNGLLGTFKTGEFSKEMENAVQNLEIDQISQPVQAKDGIHILKVLGKVSIPDPRFAREKEKIRADLMEEAFQKHLKTWIESRREDSFIRINTK